MRKVFEMDQQKQRVIRDVIHGDIGFDQRFMAIIDTPEFQRLRRIRQLSTAYFVFPTAEHTRFSHSIGTYQVMKMLIEHFRKIFFEIDIELTDNDVDLALAVALLHDLGHGPFSHAFEKALPSVSPKKNHETWTREIITSEKSQVCKVLKENFNKHFPDQVAELIEKNHAAKDGKRDLKGHLDLFFVLSSLISSQLDADRMDYLLRDAFFTGTTLGKFDIHRLIDSLTLLPNKNGEFCICVKEKYLSTVEEYLLARYQMYANIYYHPFKTEMETIVQKILQRAKEVYREDSTDEFNYLPKALKDVFEDRAMQLEDYIELDDSVLIALFSMWKNSDDIILRKLCITFLYREKYESLNILGNKSVEEIEEFKKDFSAILRRAGYKIDDLKKAYFLLLPEEDTNSFYKKRNGGINILRNNGMLNDVMAVSKVLTNNTEDIKRVLFYSKDVLEAGYKGDFSQAQQEIQSLIAYNKERNHIEIERKYAFLDDTLFSLVQEKLSSNNKSLVGYNKTSGKVVKQVDTYYDTDDKYLLRNNFTLRIRKRNNMLIMTIKVPAPRSYEDGEMLQQERFEYETVLTSDNINSEEARRWIEKYLQTDQIHFDIKHLKGRLKIINTRKKINLSKGRVEIEVAFDDVQYENLFNKKQANEYQVEMEVKSDYLHQINLVQIATFLEKEIPGLELALESKYQRGMKKTEE